MLPKFLKLLIESKSYNRSTLMSELMNEKKMGIPLIKNTTCSTCSSLMCFW